MRMIEKRPNLVKSEINTLLEGGKFRISPDRYLWASQAYSLLKFASSYLAGMQLFSAIQSINEHNLSKTLFHISAFTADILIYKLTSREHNNFGNKFTSILRDLER